jgi:hypothetical protein
MLALRDENWTPLMTVETRPPEVCMVVSFQESKLKRSRQPCGGTKRLDSRSHFWAVLGARWLLGAVRD